VSRSLAQLEARVGRALFMREGGRLVPTPEALALDEQARPVLAALARLASWQQNAPSESVLRIAASPTLAHHILPPVVAQFRKVAPEVTVQVEISNGASVIAAVADLVADLGLMDTPGFHPAVVAEPFRLAEAHCVMPRDHRLAVREVITARDLADEPIIGLPRRLSSRMALERAFADEGLKPRLVAETSTSDLAIALVGEGVGVTLLNPYPLCRADMPDLVARRFLPAISYRTSLLFPGAAGSQAIARRFADLLKSMQPDDGLTRALS
jgi:DNA-binding transcriptional LysR family regulator